MRPRSVVPHSAIGPRISDPGVVRARTIAEPARRDLIVIGASAGGIEAVRTLLTGLPPRLPASVIVAIHILPGGRSHLAEVIGIRSRLPIAFASDGEELRHGQIYVAPPGHDVFVRSDYLHVQRCRRPFRFRPSIDALFESAASSHGAHVIGVMLSGMLDDGVKGMIAIKRAGGLVVVQEPADAMYPEMPKHVMENVEVNHQGPARELGAALGQFVLA